MFMKILYTLFWIVFLGSLLYIFFFNPELFQRMFTYEGPGSPFVNTPYQN